ncbi:hypothetical protein RFI_11843 [Reticulomyxa filosa]|uniref:Sec23/Sec24 trunk domain-containing protein n=1 Tax=Reticulomyxa filosa TaxID=46433 RepID=X6NHS5_RETFI|nr:hypothetical protein RFI_11843 [Reticulomyxa filosa]|eukprot:ETO25294.1 hypothetical protein RFI_11843 [Reticulomyxa filosa]
MYICIYACLQQHIQIMSFHLNKRVSRLQSVQAAVDDQITGLAKEKPNCKVGLVTFSNEVTIIGDGINDPEFIAGDKLQKMDVLKEIGSKYKFEKNVKESSKALSDKLWGLTEKGQTALGPALVASVALASQRAGSQVILCTDGLANIGLGTLEVFEGDDTELDTVEQWYEQVANWALEKGVVVNVISITDSQCKLENLGKVCDITQGKVQRINPLQLTTNFKGILQKKVLATNVQATILLHPVIRFKSDDEDQGSELSQPGQAQRNIIVNSKKQSNEEDKQNTTTTTISKKETSSSTDVTDSKSLEEKTESKTDESAMSQIEISRQVQDIGNVFQDSRVYFEYVFRKQLLKQDQYKNLKHLIFQVQIQYVRPDGGIPTAFLFFFFFFAKMLRVITQQKPITRSKEEVIKNLNMDVIAGLSLFFFLFVFMHHFNSILIELL